ncbi:MAG: beta-ACP synthase, partial [Armatimonadota bacterium]|nr:beta-ACP synthase [Armatimonadota bacterium]
TLNWSERDPACDLDYVPNEARRHPVRCALSLSSGIGGNNAALLIEACGASKS